MATINKIKLPDNTIVELCDSRIPNSVAMQIATTSYVNQAIANAEVGGGGGTGGSFSITDDESGNVGLIFTASVGQVTDDNNGNVSIIFG